MTTWKMSNRDKARRAAKRFWDSLSNEERWIIGDELVLGSFDWREWLDSKPLPSMLNELDQIRMYWEETT